MSRSTEQGEEGAILILALVFVIIVTLSIFGLITFGGVGILNSTNLKGQRSLEYAADGATTAAIQAVRYSPFYFSNPQPEDCLPDGAVLSLPNNGGFASSTPSITIDGVSMTVDCIEGITATSTPQFTRVVTFYACLASLGVPCTAINSIVTATVDFEDVTLTGVEQCSSATQTSTCGTGEVINSWVVQTAND